MIYGIDVSEWQPNMVWQNITQDFVVIRSGYGTQHADLLAPLSRVNARRYQKGVAHYLYVLPYQSDAILQADVFLSASDFKPGEPLCLDVEVDDPNLTAWCYDAARYIKAKTGKPPLIYTNLSFLQRYDWSGLVALDCGLWLAHPDQNPHVTEDVSPWEFAAMKQYDVSFDPGVGGQVDKDSFNGSLDVFRMYGP